MDSLTQIVLGAAVGEVCLGKKLGNKAMVWGAIAGTVPDLDIIGNLFLSQLDALAFHRGISHSIFFAIMFSFGAAAFAKSWYFNDFHLNKSLRLIGAIFATLATLLLGFIFSLVGFVLGDWLGLLILGIPSLAMVTWLVRRVWRSRNSVLDIDTDISYFAWYNFFFWSIFTHPILDCCTVYGTQLLQPFSDRRISWDNISVADPIYTFVFGVCVLIASQYHRLNPKRRWINYLGIALSMTYMAWTFYNKSIVNEVLDDSIASQQIDANRSMTAPTILNNILWSATVESDSSYYLGQYSLLDEERTFDLQEVPKNYHLLNYPIDEDPTLKVLKWFSKDYCAVLADSSGFLQLNDLRYGQFDLSKGNVASNYIFRFGLVDSLDGYHLNNAQGGPPPSEERDMFGRLWRRMIGDKGK